MQRIKFIVFLQNQNLKMHLLKMVIIVLKRFRRNNISPPALYRDISTHREPTNTISPMEYYDEIQKNIRIPHIRRSRGFSYTRTVYIPLK